MITWETDTTAGWCVARSDDNVVIISGHKIFRSDGQYVEHSSDVMALRAADVWLQFDGIPYVAVKAHGEISDIISVDGIDRFFVVYTGDEIRVLCLHDGLIWECPQGQNVYWAVKERIYFELFKGWTKVEGSPDMEFVRWGKKLATVERTEDQEWRLVDFTGWWAKFDTADEAMKHWNGAWRIHDESGDNKLYIMLRDSSMGYIERLGAHQYVLNTPFTGDIKFDRQARALRAAERVLGVSIETG